jgi:hypothetical protein
LSAREGGSASGSTPLLPDEYDGLIEQLRGTADDAIPRNATVLVVSRGDDELLRIGPRRALHFPQDEFGRYAGYHPEDSDTAIAALEGMRARGAEFLLLPSTCFWWLDYYEGFRTHLEDHYERLAAGEDCMVFDLAPGSVQTPAAAETSGVSAAATRRAAQLDELLRALLPDDARWAVARPGGRAGDLPGLLEEAAADGAEFVAVPAGTRDRVDGEAGDGWVLVTSQKHLGDVYERAAGDASQTAGESPWQRLLHLFR